MKPAKKKKVVILGKLPPPYMGPAIATQIILNSELKNKFDLVHFNVTINKTIETQGKKSFNKIVASIKLYLSYNKFLNKHKPDIVLVPFGQETIGFYKDIPYLLLPKIKKIKVIGQLRGSNFKNWLNNSSFITNSVVHFTLKRTNGIIVLGNNLRYLFTDIFNEDKIFVVPNGADYKIPVRRRKEGKFRILFLANLMDNKGIIDLVDACLLLHLRNIEFELCLFGSWIEQETKDYCIAVLNKNNINYKVIPSEESPNKMQYLVDSDVFVFPPRAPEGHPWVLVEAMAAGLPIISTDQGAIVESVLENKNGFIVDTRAPEQIAEKILFFIKNEDERKQYGESSRQLYENSFSENNMVKNLSIVFNQI